MPAPRPGARQGGPRCGGGEEEEEEEEEEEGRVHNGGVRQYRRDSKQASASPLTVQRTPKAEQFVYGMHAFSKVLYMVN